MSKKDYSQLAQEIIDKVGGKDNIAACFHCVTRLRFELKDTSRVNQDEVKRIDGVMGIKEAGGMFQVIIGNEVAKVYKSVCEIADITEQKGIDEELDKPKEKLTVKQMLKKGFDAVLSYMSGCMVSLIPVMMASGLTNAVLALIGPGLLGWVSAESDTYQLLYMIYHACYYFLPIFVGYSAAKQLKIDPYMGAFMGCILIAPEMLSKAQDGSAFTIFGMNVILNDYTSTVVPVALSVAFLSIVYKSLNKVIPDILSTAFTPLLTMLIVTPVSLLFLAPLGSMIGSAIGNFIIGFGNHTGFIGVAIVSGLWEFLVMMGLHQVVGIMMITNMLEVGYSSGIGSAANNCGVLACWGIALAASLRLKNKKDKGTATGCFVSGVAGGVTEPTLSGLCLEYKRCFAALFLGGFAGGAYSALMGVRNYVLSNSNFLIFLSYTGGTTANLIHAVISLLIAMAVAFIVAYFFGFTKEEIEGIRE